MTRGMVKLSQILPGIGFIEPEVKAPKPKPQKVVGDPTREPVNKQAALIIAKANWLSKPLPVEEAPKSELEKLREEVAVLRARCASVIAENKALKRRLESMPAQKVIIKQVEKEVERAPVSSEKLALLERLNSIV